MRIIRAVLPLLLLSAALPAVAGDYSACAKATNFVACVNEQDQLQSQRDAEINALTARIERIRNVDVAARFSSCAAAESQSPRCLVEHESALEAQQNALADAALALVAQMRAFEAARNAEIALAVARIKVEQARNSEIAVSVAVLNVEHGRAFTAASNAEAERGQIGDSKLVTSAICQPYNWLTASCATDAKNRQAKRDTTTMSAAEYAFVTSHCAASPTSPRCEKERAASRRPSEQPAASRPLAPARPTTG